MKKVLTGTQVYGPATEESDIDMVLLKEDADALIAVLLDKNISTYQTEDQQEYGDEGGFYFDIGKLKFNIIRASNEKDLLSWKRTTRKMSQQFEIKNRAKRINLFQKLMQKEDKKLCQT